MKQLFAVPVLCAACLVSSLRGQSAAPAQASPTPTLRTGVQLVVEDVVVTDRNGTPVHGLQQSDFTLMDNRSPQTLKGFEEHTASAALAASAVQRPLPKGTFTNVPQLKSSAATILLLDSLNTPQNAQTYLRSQLVQFLATERPGTQTAIFVLGRRLQLLQDFTIDPELLKQAIKTMGVTMSAVSARDANDQATQQSSTSVDRMIEEMERQGNATAAAALEQMQVALLDMAAMQRSQELSLSARTTMEAMRELARYLAGVPGRKNLLWFSGSFPVRIQRDQLTTGDPSAGNMDMSAEFRQTMQVLAEDQVAVYPIDARGLQLTPSQEDMTSERPPATHPERAQRTYGTRDADPQNAQFRIDQQEEHNTMNDLADSTGGHAFYNTNGLLQAAQRATLDGESYYTLLYTPPAAARPGEFRKVDMKVNRPGVKLSYRRGYYVRTAGQPSATRATPLLSAASFAAPDTSEIPLQLQPRLVANAGGKPPIGSAAFSSGGHALYAMNLTVPSAGLSLQQGDDGRFHGNLDFVTLIYGPDGKLIDSRHDQAALALDAQRFEAMQKAGLHFHHTVMLPARGRQTVRVVVHDAGTDRVGSLRLSADEIRQAAPAM